MIKDDDRSTNGSSLAPSEDFHETITLLGKIDGAGITLFEDLPLLRKLSQFPEDFQRHVNAYLVGLIHYGCCLPAELTLIDPPKHK